MIPKLRLFIPILIILGLTACAQVPRETVELSATVGRDMAQVHEAHRELANLLFDRMESDINQFVDEKYVPYLIRKLLAGEFKDFQQGVEESLFSALDLAVKAPANIDAQTSAVDTMDIFVQIIHADIQDYRNKLLEPIRKQREIVISEIERSYLQIHYANSIVTGHLASVVKVHDAQEEILSKFGVENIREVVGNDLVLASEKISEVTAKAKKIQGSLDDAEDQFQKVSEKIKTVWKKN